MKDKNLNKHTKRNLTCKNVRTAHVCVRLSLCTSVINNTAQSILIIFPLILQTITRAQDAVYWKGRSVLRDYIERK